MKLQIKSKKSDDKVVLEVTGDVTIQTSPLLRNDLKPLFNSETSCIHVNLEGVEFMDSSGIATMVEGLQWSKRTEGRFIH